MSQLRVVFFHKQQSHIYKTIHKGMFTHNDLSGRFWMHINDIWSYVVNVIWRLCLNCQYHIRGVRHGLKSRTLVSEITWNQSSNHEINAEFAKSTRISLVWNQKSSRDQSRRAKTQNKKLGTSHKLHADICKTTKLIKKYI